MKTLYDNDALLACIGATVTAAAYEKDGETVTIETDKGTLTFYHDQDCCEHVCLEDYEGEPEGLIGGIISVAEERAGDSGETFVWTFYTLRTTKGDVDLRFLGESNGYYSMEVSVSWRPTTNKTPAPDLTEAEERVKQAREQLAAAEQAVKDAKARLNQEVVEELRAWLRTRGLVLDHDEDGICLEERGSLRRLAQLTTPYGYFPTN